MRIAFVAPGHSYHTKQWIRFFVEKTSHEILLFDVGYPSADVCYDGTFNRIDLTLRSKKSVLGWALTSVNTIRQTVRRVQPAIVHAFPAWPAGFLAALAVPRSTPVVVTGWGSEVLVSPSRRWSVKVLLSMAVRRANLLTAESLPVLRALRSFRRTNCPMAIIQFGADLTMFKPVVDRRVCRRALDLPEEGFLIVSPRAAIANSNLETVLGAFRQHARRYSDSVLVFVYAYGDRERLLRKSAEVLGILHNVIFLGKIDYSRMPLLLGAADLCISVPSSDSFPRVAWEAFAVGTPIIVSDLPWREGYVEDKVHALVVPVKDEHALADAMNLIREDKNLYKTLVRNGFKLVCDKGNYEKEMTRMNALYEALVRQSWSDLKLYGAYSTLESLKEHLLVAGVRDS